MLRACSRFGFYRYKRKCFSAISIMIFGVCFAGYLFLLTIKVDVFAASTNTKHDGFSYYQTSEKESLDLQFVPRHNRNLQNSLSGEDSKLLKTALRFPDSNRNHGENESSDTGKIYLDDDSLSSKIRGHKKLDNANLTKKLPRAIIIGVKKGGTRALLEFLRVHPNIRAPGPEPHFFDKNYNKGLAWYRDQMPPASKGQLVMEKTPSYFITKGVPERVYKMSKKTKLLIVVRDPVVRAVSDYAQLVSRKPETKPFEDIVYMDNVTKIIDASKTIVNIGVYVRHLVKWLDYFPFSQIHFVSGENLIHDPGTEVLKVQEFLGVKELITKDHFHFNETKGFPCFRKDLNIPRLHCLNNEKGRAHPHIPDSVLQRLRDFYRPFNARLYQITGQDFGWT